VDSSNGARQAPPAFVVALAAGLASIDMPIPQISAWEWHSWKFPKAVKAGDTIYARWTLTQKRAPVGSALTSIAVWRVDVHTADGALCAEGEVGASIFRADRAAVGEPAPAATPSRRRRRRRSTASASEPAPVSAPAPARQAPPNERASSSRRRRRRRTSSGGGTPNGEAPPAAAEAPLPIVEASPAPTASPRGEAANPLSRVMKRLRRT